LTSWSIVGVIALSASGRNNVMVAVGAVTATLIAV
jgi:hypothetical protein